MKNKLYICIITFAISGFLFGILLNVTGALLNYYESLKGPLFPFLNYSFDNNFIKLSPLYLSIFLGFRGYKKMKLHTLKLLEKSIGQSNEAIIIINANRLAQWANTGFINMFGYSLQEIQDKDISDILRGSHVNKEMGHSMLSKLLKGEFAQGDLVICHKNGEPFWISASVTPLLDNEGNIEGYIAIIKNINLSKIKELSIDVLYKEISNYKFALNQSCSVVTLDLDGNIIRANPNFCTINEFEADKLVGRNFNLINTSFGDYSIAKPIWNALRQGLTWKGELINRNVHGKVSWAYTIIVPLLDEAGNPQQFLLIEKDITERKLQEGQSKNNTRKLKMAIQIGLIGSWEIDLNGNITLSDELRTIIKEPLNSPIDLTSLLKRISPEDLQMVQDKMTLTQTTFERSDMEYKFLVNGKIHYLATSNTAQFNKDKEFIGLFGITQDITDVKLTELALIKAQKEKILAMQIAKLGSLEININGVLTLSTELKELIQEPQDVQLELSYVFDRMIPEEVIIMQNNLTSTSTTFKKNEMEFQYLLNGNVRYFKFTNTAQFDLEGNFKSIFGIVQDITPFKLIELALKKSEEEKEVILNNTQAIICNHEKDV